MEIKHVSKGEWIKALLADTTKVHLKLYRYHQKSEAWRSAAAKTKEHLVVFVERGFFNAKVDGKKLRLNAGEILWVPPGCVREFYGVRNISILRHHNIRFSIHDRTRSAQTQRPLVFNTNPELRSRGWDLHSTFQLIQEAYECSHRYPDARLRGLLLLLTTGFLNLPKRMKGKGEVRERTFQVTQRRRIQRKILADIKKGIEPSELAQLLDLSLDYFTRLFRKTYGVAPRTFLKRERMRVASVRLRESTLSVAQVAQEFGMDNVSFFCRQFREVMGSSPGAYRQLG